MTTLHTKVLKLRGRKKNVTYNEKELHIDLTKMTIVLVANLKLKYLTMLYGRLLLMKTRASTMTEHFSSKFQKLLRGPNIHNMARKRSKWC